MTKIPFSSVYSSQELGLDAELATGGQTRLRHVFNQTESQANTTLLQTRDKNREKEWQKGSRHSI